MSTETEENIPDGFPEVPTNNMGANITIRYPDIITPDCLSSKSDMQSLCRICAAQTTKVIPLFKGLGVEYDLPAKMRKYISLRVLRSESLPQQICEACASALLSWHELVRAARLTDYMLRSRFRSVSLSLPPSPPSETAGTEVIKNGVNESLNSSSSVNEIEEEQKLLNVRHDTIRAQSSTEGSKGAEPAEMPKVVIIENGKRYVSCDMCKKNVLTGSWRRHQRAHRGERRYSCHACGLAFADSGNLARHARARHARLRPHVCPDCGRSFARHTHLQDHVRSHRDARDFICDVCGKASKSAAALRMHTRTHDAPRRFQCMECGSKFKRNGELRAHVTIHTGERAHRCPCGRAFRLRSQLTAHTRTHAGRLQLDGYVDAGTDPLALPRARVCKICPLHVPAPRYNFHIGNERANVVFRCEECHSYLDTDDLLFQMKGHTLDRVPEHVKVDFYRIEKAALEQLAPTDDQARSDLDRLNAYFHKWQEELIKKRERQIEEASEQTAVDQQSEGSERGSEPLCDEPKAPQRRSSKRTSDESRRERDSDGELSPPKRGRVKPKRSTDSETSPAKRQNKRRAFIAKSSPRKELPSADDGPPEAPPSTGPVRIKKEASEKSPRASRTCPICGKQYRASSSYFYHMKYFHKRSREHECPVCNKKFGTKANLAQHASIHTGAYDLECKECGKRFKSKPSLYIHEQSHGGPKRWACSQCGRSFRWRTHLARHVTRHAAERAHVCGTCGRGFSVRCDLLRHARTHSAAEYHCATCGLKFAQKRYLQVHVMKKHREPPAAVVTRS